MSDKEISINDVNGIKTSNTDDQECNENFEDGILNDIENGKIYSRNALERLRLDTDVQNFTKTVNENAKQIYQALRELEIYDLDILLQYNPDELLEKLKPKVTIPRFGKAIITAIFNKAQEIAGTKAFISSADIQVSNTYIHTGSIALDNLLGGGIALGESYEVFGGFGGGKTQLCATTVCRSYLPIEYGGLMQEGKDPHYTIWIDSEETYIEMLRNKEIKEKIKEKAKKADISPIEYARGYIKKIETSRMERLCNGLAQLYKLDFSFTKNVKPYILHVPVDTVTQQLRRIEEMNEYTSKYNVKIIIFDSITKLIRQERAANEAYGQKISRTINVMLGQLNRIKTKCQAALICTNQVYEDLAKSQFVHGSKRYTEITYGGGAVTHNLDKRIHVWSGKNNVKNAELQDSCSDITGEVIEFIITDHGISDVE